MTRCLLWRTGFGVVIFASILGFDTMAATAQPDTPTQSSIKLIGVIAALAPGTPWLSLKSDTLCVLDSVTQTWNSGRAPQELSLYSAAFKTELEQAGYKVVTPGQDDLFDPEAGTADYQVAAEIVDEHIDGCINNGEWIIGPSKGDVRGSSAMKVNWQIYSAVRKQVVARISTSASARLDNSVPGGVTRLISESFAANLRALAASADFRATITAPKALAKDFITPGQQSKIVLAGSLKAPKVEVADAVASVVTILTGDGSGSGFLVSSDGYMLTDAHVVGDEKSVRVRWSDGLETLAEVVRSSKFRDVAIIKTNARDRTPFALKRGPANPGQRVYAIGSPKGKDFQSTVTSGIISAMRVYEGQRYIQSDTVVSHGSSGGPLLDETGAVLGLTDLGIDNSGPAGLNLFTPIGDAMDFLALEQQ